MAMIKGSGTGGKRKGAGRPRSAIPKKTWSFWAAPEDVALVLEIYGTVGRLVAKTAAQIRKKKMVELLQQSTFPGRKDGKKP